MKTQIIKGISDLLDQFDVMLFDAWGVLHDGQKAYPYVVETLQKLREKGKKSVVVSNSPRLQFSVAETLSQNGIPENSYDFLHSSGQEGVYFFEGNHPFGTKCYHFGDDSHRIFFDHVSLQRVESVDQADFILNTGFLYDEGGRDINFIDSELPMVCLNPDVTVLISGEKKLCAGYYAKLYKEKGGKVHYIGKPYPSIYERAIRLAGLSEKARPLIIGDSFETDILGGKKAGIPSILTLTGIHHTDLIKNDELDEKAFDKLVEQYSFGPNYIIPQVQF